MPVTVVVGLQWGDEGKGKIVDRLAEGADIVLRFHGGANAGHTVVNPKGKFALHLVPSGICNPRAICLITNGVVVDPGVLQQELAMLRRAGIRVNGRFFISPRAHVVTEMMKQEDRKIEARRGKAKIGTTGRGIGPTYAAKALRTGIRVEDFVKTPQGKFLRPYVKETFTILRRGLDAKKRILAEGAHGVLLDLDWGTYPYVTSSNVLPGALHAAAGIPPQEITRVVGVCKAYQTRVGAGPFPTEQDNAFGNLLREKGREYGTTTGRPRRCGWLDLVLLRFACDLVRPTELVITKLDVLDDFSEIPVAIRYRSDGSPAYRIMRGWRTATAGAKKLDRLPRAARTYLDFIERTAGVPIRYVSTGPDREQLIAVSAVHGLR